MIIFFYCYKDLIRTFTEHGLCMSLPPETKASLLFVLAHTGSSQDQGLIALGSEQPPGFLEQLTIQIDKEKQKMGKRSNIIPVLQMGEGETRHRKVK